MSKLLLAHVLLIHVVVCDGNSGRFQASRFSKRRNTKDPKIISDFYPSSELYRQSKDESIDLTVATQVSSKAWPPWPFSVFSGSGDEHPSKSSGESEEYIYDSSSSRLKLVWAFSRESLRATLNQVQAIGSQMWFHLPPASTPLILYAFKPQKQKIVESSEVTYKTVIPFFSNSFARKCVLGGVSLAVLSWAHSEVNRKKRLEPLPLPPQYSDVNSALLPPFLPEEMPVDVLTNTVRTMDGEDDEDTEMMTPSPKVLPMQLQQQWNSFKGQVQKPQRLRYAISEWKRVRDIRARERHNAYRLAVFDELVAFQALKRRSRKRRKNQMGYALVTGASRGIGRSIAVELARWEIPLILVARDVNRLTKLAYDIEACYGVKCCVLEADLTHPRAAESIFDATKAAGLEVDILVNNAGVSRQTPLAVDMPVEEATRMIHLNAMAVSTLSLLYGNEMKQRRRGRVMTVSSVCGKVAGLPSMAVYAATKAFEKTLSLSMSKELEPFGVGMTCLMPGAVRDTDFRSSSNSQEALVWKLPFYAKAPEAVARVGVRSMLRGDTECVVGWQNRLFTRLLQPALPQRIHNLIAEVAFSPLRLPFMHRTKPMEESETAAQLQIAPESVPEEIHNLRSVPRLLDVEKTSSSDKKGIGDDGLTSEIQSQVDAPISEKPVEDRSDWQPDPDIQEGVTVAEQPVEENPPDYQPDSGIQVDDPILEQPAQEDRLDWRPASELDIVPEADSEGSPLHEERS